LWKGLEFSTFDYRTGSNEKKGRETVSLLLFLFIFVVMANILQKTSFTSLKKKGLQSKVHLPQLSLVFGFPQVVCKRVKSTFKLKTKSMPMSRLKNLKN